MANKDSLRTLHYIIIFPVFIYMCYLRLECPLPPSSFPQEKKREWSICRTHQSTALSENKRGVSLLEYEEAVCWNGEPQVLSLQLHRTCHPDCGPAAGCIYLSPPSLFLLTLSVSVFLGLPSSFTQQFKTHNILHKTLLLKSWIRTSLVVQYLGLCLPMQGIRVPSLVRELRSRMTYGQKTNRT